jgi:hypothetical protein
MSEALVQSLWNEHVAWSKTADRLKARRNLWRTLVLVLIICGAALQTLAADVSSQTEGSDVRWVIAAAGAVALALVALFNQMFLTPDSTREWLRARSVSEGIKSEVYTFRAGAAPYDEANAVELLHTRVQGIVQWATDLEAERRLTDEETGSSLPPPLDAEKYLQLRVDQQIEEYYRRRGRQNARLAKRYQTISTALAGTVAVLGALATVYADLSTAIGPWIAVLTTIAGSIATHAAASRYDFQATTFFATARQLEDLSRAWRAADKARSTREWSDFVRACEDAISAENRGWMAKLDDQT